MEGETVGTVRQLWESTNPAGEWAVTFDGKYTRLAAPDVKPNG